MKKIFWSVLFGSYIMTYTAISYAADTATSIPLISMQKHLVVICQDNSTKLVLQGDPMWSELKWLLEKKDPKEKEADSFKRAVARACKN